VPLELTDDRMCYICGKDNPHGFRLDFEHPEKGLLRARVVFRKEHQGYKDIVHGGLVAAVLDEMMVNLAWVEGLPAVTAEITVRLKKPVRVGRPVLFEGRFDKVGPRAIRASASARDEGSRGELLATAESVCVRVPAIRQKSA